MVRLVLFPAGRAFFNSNPMQKLSQRDIERVLAAVDIVRLVSVYNPKLRRTGVSYTCTCFFHKEQTPSFSVNPTKKLWYCHGCRQGGNAIQFIQKIERISFFEAIKSLASRFGVTLECNTESDNRYAYERLLVAESTWFWRHACELGFGAEWQGPHTVERYAVIRANWPAVVLAYRDEQKLNAAITQVFARATAACQNEVVFEGLLQVIGTRLETTDPT